MTDNATPSTKTDSPQRLLGPLTELAAQAGALIMSVNRAAMIQHRKIDGSTVTEADHAADDVIIRGLVELAPQIPVISEERVHQAGHEQRERSFFLVDPLDGTQEFISGRDEFTVNIALVTDGQPVLGVIGAPALGLIWRGIVGEGAERLTVDSAGIVSADAKPIRTRPHPGPASPCIIGVSRSHGDSRSEAFIAERPGAVRLALGSAIKFCRVAEGHADLYPRLSPTSEWDVAAGCAIVSAAGGCVTDSQGKPLHFGPDRDDFIVPEFIVWGDPAAARRPAQ